MALLERLKNMNGQRKVLVGIGTVLGALAVSPFLPAITLFTAATGTAFTLGHALGLGGVGLLAWAKSAPGQGPVDVQTTTIRQVIPTPPPQEPKP